MKGSEIRDRLLSLLEGIDPACDASAFAMFKNKSSLFLSSLLDPLLRVSSSAGGGFSPCLPELSIPGPSAASAAVAGSLLMVEVGVSRLCVSAVSGLEISGVLASSVEDSEIGETVASRFTGDGCGAEDLYSDRRSLDLEGEVSRTALLVALGLGLRSRLRTLSCDKVRCVLYEGGGPMVVSTP
jgi:hypothetical protein